MRDDLFSMKQDGGVGCQPGLSARAATRHVITTNFQPAYRAEISARAEIRHVIGP